MTLFHISWEIEIEAESIEAAAARALEIQRDSNSIATLFYVTPQCIECRQFHDDERRSVDIQRIEAIHVH